MKLTCSRASGGPGKAFLSASYWLFAVLVVSQAEKTQLIPADRQILLLLDVFRSKQILNHADYDRITGSTGTLESLLEILVNNGVLTQEQSRQGNFSITSNNNIGAARCAANS